MAAQDQQQLRQEVIYAPVAELQHKINQRHNPGQMIQNHNPGQMIQNHNPGQMQNNNPGQVQGHNPGQMQNLMSGGSPEGEQYGFGVQFQHQQNQFYHHHVQDPHQR